MPDYIYLLENRLSPPQQNALRQVREAAREAGMTVFLSGGAVRDMTSGFPVRDLDFSVQGNALKLRKALEKAGGVFWGEHEHSRTLFFWFPGSVRVEIASARREEYPKPGKAIYHWAPILEDLRRRDFTANAMAISLNEGSWGLLLDPLNGFADIEARHLRLASNYGFIEDPVRMIRAIRLSARTGWEMDERTRSRYQNAKDENLIEQISQYQRGYELEEIGHEEDPLRALQSLEDDGWMKHLYPAWGVAKADTKGLEELNHTLIRLLMLGIHPDPSAAHMELLTAKLTPKENAGLKELLPRHGFVEQWNNLEHSAKEFSKELLNRNIMAPSATWKLITGYQAEAVLWAAFNSKNPQVREKFNNFFNVWPEARQKIPTTLLADMRITPELPEYGKVAEELFFQFMDGKLQTEEEIRAFLEPYSPPAPPPPVVIRRPRGRRAEPKIEEEEEDLELSGIHGDAEDGEEEEEHEEAESGVEEIVPLPPARQAAPAKVAEKSAPAKAAKDAPAPAAKPAEKKAAKPAEKAAAKPAEKHTEKHPDKHADKHAEKPAAKTPAKSVKPPVKAAPPEKKAAAKKPEARPAAKSAKPAAKSASKKQASVSAHKPARHAKVIAKPAAKKNAKPAKAEKHGKKDAKHRKH
jgi:tRNA nucleotidyltransferase (CCA-adding enzyme)